MLRHTSRALCSATPCMRLKPSTPAATAHPPPRPALPRPPPPRRLKLRNKFDRRPTRTLRRPPCDLRPILPPSSFCVLRVLDGWSRGSQFPVPSSHSPIATPPPATTP